MKQRLLLSSILLTLALGATAFADEAETIRDENEGYRLTEETTPLPAAAASLESSREAGVRPTVSNPAMDELRAGFEERRTALVDIVHSTTDHAAVLQAENQLEQLRFEQNLAERELLIHQAEFAGNTRRVAELRDAQVQDTATPAPVRNTERVLTHEEKMQAEKARENRK
jgi:hypothetical protein